jgi:hypothetical protein
MFKADVQKHVGRPYVLSCYSGIFGVTAPRKAANTGFTYCIKFLFFGFLGKRSGGNHSLGPKRPETCLWADFQRRGRNARKIIQWMIFSEGRAAAPERPEGPGQATGGCFLYPFAAVKMSVIGPVRGRECHFYSKWMSE